MSDGRNGTLLVGHRIVAVDRTADKHVLRFTLEDHPMVYADTVADCCSTTWVEHIEGVDRLLGAVVLAVENIPMPDRGCAKAETFEKDDEAEAMTYYGCAITTERGRCVVDYRNESNGYYGGWLDWGTQAPKDWSIKPPSAYVWQAVTEDL